MRTIPGSLKEQWVLLTTLVLSSKRAVVVGGYQNSWVTEKYFLSSGNTKINSIFAFVFKRHSHWSTWDINEKRWLDNKSLWVYENGAWLLFKVKLKSTVEVVLTHFTTVFGPGTNLAYFSFKKDLLPFPPDIQLQCRNNVKVVLRSLFPW